MCERAISHKYINRLQNIKFFNLFWDIQFFVPHRTPDTRLLLGVNANNQSLYTCDFWQLFFPYFTTLTLHLTSIFLFILSLNNSLRFTNPNIMNPNM